MCNGISSDAQREESDVLRSFGGYLMEMISLPLLISGVPL